MNTLRDLEMNNHRDKNYLNILDLPNEVLLIILRKLNMIDLLSSIVNINRRFLSLALDPMLIRHLDLTNVIHVNSLDDQPSSVDAEILERVSENILPLIHHHVQQLTLHQYSMKSILRVTGSYPQLRSLSFLHSQEEALYQYLTENSTFRDLAKQITHLDIDVIMSTQNACSTIAKIFALILSVCEKLIVLNFCDVVLTRKSRVAISENKSFNYMSSTLVKLKIKATDMIDCLSLLYGRFESLSTLIINVKYMLDPMRTNFLRFRELPKMKCFSLMSFDASGGFDDLVVPLLLQMINLEELSLYLKVKRMDSTYIDGIQLHDQLLTHMRHLKKFMFNIKTTIYVWDTFIERQSNDDIQRSFIGRGFGQVASYVLPDPPDNPECHIYSLPYAFEHYVDLDNSFQGGMFNKVRYLTMGEINPFRQELFQLISKDFPSLEFLYIQNIDPQEVKQHPSTPIIFPHLTLLHVEHAHDDYIEQFLLTEYAQLPHLMHLYIKYRSLRKITNNFTNDTRQLNLCTLKSLVIKEPFVRPMNFHEYFPLL